MATTTKLGTVPTLADLLKDSAKVTGLPREAIPHLRGELAELDTLLLSRLFADSEARPGADSDRLLTAAEAAQKLGATEDWLYRHSNTLPFAVRVGKKHLRFSEAGMDRYIRQRVGR